jgi:hypothetical protein
VSPVMYDLGFCIIPEDGILHSHRHDNLKSYIKKPVQNIEYRSEGVSIYGEFGTEGLYSCSLRST